MAKIALVQLYERITYLSVGTLFPSPLQSVRCSIACFVGPLLRCVGKGSKPHCNPFFCPLTP
jgi:hypothetical protein